MRDDGRRRWTWVDGDLLVLSFDGSTLHRLSGRSAVVAERWLTGNGSAGGSVDPQDERLLADLVAAGVLDTADPSTERAVSRRAALGVGVAVGIATLSLPRAVAAASGPAAAPAPESTSSTSTTAPPPQVTTQSATPGSGYVDVYGSDPT